MTQEWFISPKCLMSYQHHASCLNTRCNVFGKDIPFFYSIIHQNHEVNGRCMNSKYSCFMYKCFKNFSFQVMWMYSYFLVNLFNIYNNCVSSFLCFIHSFVFSLLWFEIYVFMVFLIFLFGFSIFFIVFLGWKIRVFLLFFYEKTNIMNNDDYDFRFSELYEHDLWIICLNELWI